MSSKKKIQKRLHQFIFRDIWIVGNDDGVGKVRLKFYKLLRILSLIFNGIGANKIISRAAALSYSSLIAMGPLMAIMFMVSSWVLVQKEDDHLAMTQFMRVAAYVFPQLTLGQEETVPPSLKPVSGESESGEEASSPYSTDFLGEEEEVEINPEFLKLVENFVTPTRSGAITSIGAAVLLFISIQLIISVETAFNQIWGVRRGREWSHRIVFYWAFISLGMLVSLLAIALLSAGTIINMVQNLPFGETLVAVMRWTAPITSFLLLVAILTSFYRFIPNTAVRWIPAVIGAVVVTLCLMLNNYFSFLYVQQVVRFQSLYGYTAIIPILMVGMYIFWIFILMGGQISYAVQNADYMSKKELWEDTSQTTREILALAILILVSRRFRECMQPINSEELASTLRAPGKIMNECINRLIDIRLISQVSPVDQDEHLAYYQPAKPLNRIYLNEFKSAFEAHGNNQASDLILRTDPLLDYYQRKVAHALQGSIGNDSLEELFANQFPILPEGNIEA